MISGLPVVVTDKMAPKEQVSHGIDGVVASNASEFGSAVDRLAREEGLRLRMGKAARAHAVQQSWGKVFDRLLKHDELAAELHQAKTPVVRRLAVFRFHSLRAFGLTPSDGSSPPAGFDSIHENQGSSISVTFPFKTPASRQMLLAPGPPPKVPAD